MAMINIGPFNEDEMNEAEKAKYLVDTNVINSPRKIVEPKKKK